MHYSENSRRSQRQSTMPRRSTVGGKSDHIRK